MMQKSSEWWQLRPHSSVEKRDQEVLAHLKGGCEGKEMEAATQARRRGTSHEVEKYCQCFL